MGSEVQGNPNAEMDVATQNDAVATVETETEGSIHHDAESKADADVPDVMASVLAAAQFLQQTNGEASAAEPLQADSDIPPASLGGGTDDASNWAWWEKRLPPSAAPPSSLGEGTHNASTNDDQPSDDNTYTSTGYGKVTNTKKRHLNGSRFTQIQPIDNRPIAKCGGCIQYEQGYVVPADTNIREHRLITRTNKMTYLNRICISPKQPSYIFRTHFKQHLRRCCTVTCFSKCRR